MRVSFAIEKTGIWYRRKCTKLPSTRTPVSDSRGMWFSILCAFMHVCRRTPKIHAFQQLQLGESHLKSTETYARSARRKLYKLHTYTKGMAASIQNARIKNKPLKKCSSPPNHSPFSYRSPHFAPFFATQAREAKKMQLTGSLVLRAFRAWLYFLITKASVPSVFAFTMPTV